jgi:hypothetical protein
MLLIEVLFLLVFIRAPGAYLVRRDPRQRDVTVSSARWRC